MSDAIVQPVNETAPRRRSRLLTVLGADRKAQFAVVVLTIFLACALLAPVLAPYDPNAMDYDMMSAPSSDHLLGTDDLGRDLFSRIIHGTRISLFVGVTTVVIALAIGIVLGVLAGYFGGWFDTIIMRYIDLQWAFPNFIIAVYLVAVFGTGLANVMVAISLAFIDDFARIARGMVLTIKEEQYVAAARTLGASDVRIMARHILPNAMAPIIVQATVSVSYAILGEASLSFLGLGVPPPMASWGSMIGEGRDSLDVAPRLAFLPAAALFLTVLAFNLVGDTLRALTDPRQGAL